MEVKSLISFLEIIYLLLLLKVKNWQKITENIMSFCGKMLQKNKNRKNKFEKLKRIVPLTKMLNDKRVHVCDYQGMCTNKAYREVYPSFMSKAHEDSGWSYLCKKHFEQEKKFKGNLPYCTILYFVD